ncbi:dehydrogenase/reductase SDR family member on chromosome X-like isoform X1 [Camellia sinensis]|uniref:dehydrogenase/reductase SDR family member on chromosome X-like isoform X1 n=1 Tax=Camellia sinensis TaxID=4442 RepID=UPI0010365581|nr:dehydrogenase/reductase SDR family member on chromosome X-like isoform X1 [Camellia sinensis]
MMELKDFKEALNFAFTTEFWRMGVFWTISLVLSYLQLFTTTLFSRTPISHPRCSPSPPPPPATTATSTPTSSPTRRPVCIITGATSGLGAAAAYFLSMEGFFVVLVGRSSHLLSKVMEDIERRNKNAHLKCFQVDLSSFQSILKFKSSFQQWLMDSDLHSSVQLLINNAGILATTFRLTAEGYDQMMGTNYIGAFSLTKVLLPLLENSPVPARIVNVTSFTHRSVSDIQVDKETVSGKSFLKFKKYPCAHIYEYSKLCLLLFSYELHRHFGVMGKSHQVSVIAVDPGAVKTNIMREVPTCISYVALLALKLLGLLQSPENGVRSILDAALAPPEISGVYFFGGNGRTVNSSALSYDTKLAKELWDTSCDLFLELQLAFKDTSF